MPKSKKPFKKAYLEITSQCNLDCSFCPKTSRPPKFITVGQFDYLLGQVQPLTNFVYLHLMGCTRSWTDCWSCAPNEG